MSDGVLISPSDDPIFRAALSQVIPPHCQQVLRVCNGIRVDSIFVHDVYRVVEFVYGRSALCQPCWNGTPCETWMRVTQRKVQDAQRANPQAWGMPSSFESSFYESCRSTFAYERTEEPRHASASPHTFHVLTCFDGADEPCWLLLNQGLPPWMKKALPFWSHYDQEVEAWRIDRETQEDRQDFARFTQKVHSHNAQLCTSCLRGHPCAVWQDIPLQQEGYRAQEPTPTEEPKKTRRNTKTSSSSSNKTSSGPGSPWVNTPREKAAEMLGIQKLPASKQEIQKAFAKKALLTHPDKGGTDAAFKELLYARKVLLEG